MMPACLLCVLQVGVCSYAKEAAWAVCLACWSWLATHLAPFSCKIFILQIHFKKFIMFTACSDCRPFGAFIIHLCSLAGKKWWSVLNPLLPWSFLVQVAWSFVINVMRGHISFVEFSFWIPFRTFFNASKSLLLYFFLKNVSFISLLNHKDTQSIE